MRRNTSKAALYESIMRKVSRVVKNALNESQDGLDYWKVDFIDEYDEGNGFSLCISCPTNAYKDDEIIDVCLRNDLIDKEDVEDFTVNVEEISDDPYEMKFWKSEATMVK